ncbi:MAG: protein kinase, partial [Muribaculaceae bacterium]
KEVEASKRAFISEAQRLQRLGIDHPNIVNVDEVFEANGTAYYVMEYLDGGSLADYVKAHGGRLSWEETTKMMQPICEAVAMLHSNNVAHYDIKPLNIMVMTEDQALRPVLIDFGLAKHYDGQGQATSTLAAGGYTPGYAPLEQLGGLRQFSPTADVYAMAATICFCLTGHAPAPAAELSLDALCDELLNLGVEDTVVNVLCKAMELRPADRPANAGVLSAALFRDTPLQTVIKPRFVEFEQATQIMPSRANMPDRPAQRPLSYRTIYRNLDLQVTLNGIKYYFTVDEWKRLSTVEQSRFTKQGIVIDYNGLRFLVKLKLERHNSDSYESSDSIYFTWEEAKQWVDNMCSGWHLPTKDEGKAIADQYKEVNAAFEAFGGNSGYGYWTITRYSYSSAWCFYLNHGSVGVSCDYKCVRVIREI